MFWTFKCLFWFVDICKRPELRVSAYSRMGGAAEWEAQTADSRIVNSVFILPALPFTASPRSAESWRVENCANPGEQVAGSTRAGVPANRGVITYTLATQRTEIREPHCPISEHWRGHLSRFTPIELAGAREPLDSALCASSVFPQVKSTFVYLFHWLNPLM